MKFLFFLSAAAVRINRFLHKSGGSLTAGGVNVIRKVVSAHVHFSQRAQDFGRSLIKIFRYKIPQFLYQLPGLLCLRLIFPQRAKLPENIHHLFSGSLLCSGCPVF